MNALDRLMPLAAVAGIDNPKRLPPSEVNRWYEVMRQDDPEPRAAARLSAARAVPRHRYRPAAGCTDLPETAPAKRA